MRERLADACLVGNAIAHLALREASCNVSRMNRLAMNSLAFIATCAALTGVAGAATPQPPHPLGSPGNWVNSEDYPPGPLRREEEGIVGFTLTIRPDGTVGGCEVTKSSGSDDLDQATCTLITERARFEAAADDHGHHVAGTWSSSVRWQIPKNAPPEPGVLVFSMVVNTDGHVSDCRIERAEGKLADTISPDGSIKAMSGCPDSDEFEPYRDSSGNPVAKHVRVTMRAEVEDLPAAPSSAHTPSSIKVVPVQPNLKP